MPEPAPSNALVAVVGVVNDACGPDLATSPKPTWQNKNIQIIGQHGSMKTNKL